MSEIQNPYIKLKASLDQNDYKDINNLKKICLEYDKTSLKLELEYKLNRAKGKNDSINLINEFMYYDQNNLLGYIGMCNFGGVEVEVNGMIHPDYRKKGIFKQLYFLVMDEWKKSDGKSMLLLCDHNSITGKEFIKSTAAVYEHSEYEMFLRDCSKENDKPKSVVLRKATNNDVKEIAFQNSIYFGMEIKEDSILLPEDEAKMGIHNFIAEVNDQIIGKVNLEINDGQGGIYGLGVLPEFRSRGYGREILMSAIEKLKEKKAKSIMLQVVVKNKNALSLYKSCGFEEASTMDYYQINK